MALARVAKDDHVELCRIDDLSTAILGKFRLLSTGSLAVLPGAPRQLVHDPIHSRLVWTALVVGATENPTVVAKSKSDNMSIYRMRRRMGMKRRFARGLVSDEQIFACAKTR